MSKDRLKDLRKANPWPAVTYGKLSRQLSHPQDQPSTSAPSDKDSEINQFLNETQRTHEVINRIVELTQQVKQSYIAALQPTASPKVTQELDAKTEEIKKLSYETSSRLKKLEQTQTFAEDYDVTSAQWRIRESQISVLTRRFRDVMVEYNKESMLHRDRCKKVIARELEMSAGSVTDLREEFAPIAHIRTGNRRSYDELDEMLDNGVSGGFSLSIMVHTQNAQHALDEIEARHRDITKLEKSIKELHDMYLDLAVLISDQGEMVDSIEHNVSKAVDFVEDAAENVHMTQQYHKATVKKRIVLLAILSFVSVALIGLVVLFIHLTRKGYIFG